MDQAEIAQETLDVPLLSSSGKQAETNRFRNVDRAPDCPKGKGEVTACF